MIRGIYTSATGMVAELDRQNVIANNLANADTVGFKADNTVSIPFQDMLLNAYRKQSVQPIGKLGLGVMATGEYVDLRDGSVNVTDNMTDVALQGKGLFAVSTPAGTRYTRAGNFIIDKEGYLVNQSGYQVLGENGAIRLTGSFSISDAGEIFQDGNLVDKLQIVDSTNAKKEGEGLYILEQTAPATNYHIVQGSLEHSNVNTIQQMVSMITVTRSYDTNQKALLAHDETLSKAVNELAK